MTARRRGVLALATVAALCRALPAGAQTMASAEALERWVAAVRTHEPGRPDAALQSVVSLSYGARVELNTSMTTFLERLRLHGTKLASRSKAARKVSALARGVEEDPGVNAFMERAAVLHSDAVIFTEWFPAPQDDRPPASASVTTTYSRDGALRIQTQEPPPMLRDERLVLTRDGQITGQAVAAWHLPFARSLLDLTRGDADFLGEWYHAVAAYLFANGMNGDATGHLARAALALPDDARLLFDRASYAETLGLPIYQAVSEDPSARSPSGAGPRLPSEDRTNAEAERLYRRALEVDPWLVEARVRLARLLDHRGQQDEAAAEIAKALDAKIAGVIGFYAHIVAGRIASRQGRYDEALQAYRAASALFPDAQSARLGASQAALMAADVADTLAPLERLGAGGASFDADPWWQYQLGAGRDVNPLMIHLWARVKSP